MSHPEPKTPLLRLQQFFERNATGFVLGVTAVAAVGGMVELVPLFAMKQGGQPSTLEAKAAGLVKPRGPLAAAGFDLYVKEGCYNCHAQMIRPFRSETLRYGHYSFAADAQYDRPHQYSSKRTGPDLARVGGKYPDAWHVQHMRDPQSMVPSSIMPPYPWLEKNPLDVEGAVASMKAQKALGVPYTDAEIEAARTQLLGRTELDAVVAYLQSLGVATKDLPNEGDE